MDAALVGQIVGGIIGALAFGVIIWLAAKLAPGIEVDNFGWAVSAGLIISAFTNFFATIIPNMTGILGAIIGLIVAAVVILISDKILKGVHVSGFTGAIIAALAIGFVQFLIGLALAAAVGTVA